MRHVPQRVEYPSNPNPAIRLQAVVREHRYHGCERKLPHAEAPVEVCRARACDHNGVEILAVRLSEQGCQERVQNADCHRHHNIHDPIFAVPVDTREWQE